MAEPNKMLIDATHPEETRVVVLRGGRVEEFDYESAARKQLRGNIYLAKVTRVEPSLQAAFVEYGGNRHGFLAFNEIHPDYYQIPVADRIALIEEEAAAEAAEEAAAEARAEARARREAQREAARAQREASQRSSGKAANADDDDEDEDDESNEIATIDIAEGEYGDDDRGHDDDREPETRAESTGLGEERLSEPAPAAERDDDGHSGHVCDNPDHHHEHTASPAPLSAAVDAGSDGESGEAITSAAEDAAAERASNGGEAAEPANDNANGNGSASPAAEADETVEQVGAEDALEELPSRPRRRQRNYKIQEVIKRRQVILVQVVKEERGNKGAALTTYLSLAGRYTVLMPNTARGGGISRKITQPQDRKRLKAIAAELEVPEGMGLIIRTAGAARTKQEIKRDFEYLLRLWESVRDLTLQSTAPSLVYEEGNLIKRSIRDLYNKDVEEIIVAGDEAFHEARDFMRMLMPSHAKNVIHYQAPEPLFTRYQIERQLNAMFSPYVTLRSGGYLVINQTEALVAVDVNSGKSTREFSIEETALNTNLEAADEIARQLKLRDLAGLIVVDFIDMEEKRNNRAVERRLKDALRFDRARIQVGRISHFGLLEMSRQRLRTGVLEGSTSQCPHCQGTGIIRSVESVALAVLRGLEDSVMGGARTSLVAVTTSTVALYILNKKRAFITDMETRLGMPIMVEGSDKMQGANFSIEKGNAPALPTSRPQRNVVNMDWGFGDEDEQTEPAQDEVDDEAAFREPREERSARANGDGESEGEGEGNGDGRRRRRRRRRGRRGERDARDVSAGEGEGNGSSRESFDDEDGEGDDDRSPASGDNESVADVAHAADAEGDGDEGDGDEDNAAARGAGESGSETRRRRRRGRRGGRRNRDRQDRTEPGEAVAVGEGDADTEGEDGDGDASEAIGAAAVETVGESAAAEPQQSVAEEAAAAAAAAATSKASSVVASPDEPETAKLSTAAVDIVEVVEAESVVLPESMEQVGEIEPPAAAPEASPRRSRGEPVSSSPRVERVVVSTDPAAAKADEEPQQTRKGWWQRRFGA
ncbi:MAG: Rne/Rng family ribonuclease [Hyphomicrobiaceae bacterium]|nr:Rne/Rng family ribonuclease [Hyphomicrobiaceae bacterium]